jgi:hypothetical protein
MSDEMVVDRLFACCFWDAQRAEHSILDEERAHRYPQLLNGVEF